MNCPNCGTSLPDEAHFCPNCGTRMEAIAQTPYIPGQTDDYGEASAQGGDYTPEQQKKNTSIGVIVVVALAVLLVIGGIVGITMFMNAPRQRSATQIGASSGTHGVTFMASIDDYTEGSSRIPVQITGTQDDGTAVDEVVYLAYSGVDAELAKGSYHAEVVGSPITPEGVIYEIPTLTIDFTLGDDLADGESYTMPQDLAFQFVPIEAANVTDAQIADAVSWAEQDSGSTANVEALRQAAIKRRDDALAVTQPEEPQQPDEQSELDEAIADAKAEGKQVFTGTVRVMDGYELGEEYDFDAEEALGPDAAKDWVLLVFDEDTDVEGFNGDGDGSRVEKLDRIRLPESMAAQDGKHVTIAVKELWFASDTVGLIASAGAADAEVL